jgi:hypothetical protein
MRNAGLKNELEQLMGKTIIGIKILDNKGISIFFDDESCAYIDMADGSIAYECRSGGVGKR